MRDKFELYEKIQLVVTGAAIGFLMGAAATVALVWKLRETPQGPERPQAEVSLPAPVAPDAVPSLRADPVEELRARRLEMPLQDSPRDRLRASFDDRRDGTRNHEAIDIMAPRNTPVVAVEDGTIAKLFYSAGGGITLYQFDPSSQYVYYYAHLERYADGLKEGARISRKQVIGYVGTSGNAPKDAPHLHFAIFKTSNPKQWWQGTPLDPYRVLK